MESLLAYGGWLNFQTWTVVVVVLAAVLAMGYRGAPYYLWAAVLLVIGWGLALPQGLLLGFAIVSILFIVPFLRAQIFSRTVMEVMRALKLMPKISETERIALESGKVWVEQDLFSGRPDFNEILKKTTYPELTERERAYLEGPVEKLCAMVDDWEYWQTRSLPQEVWDYICEQKFLGMIIPEKYGGLGFSALAHSAVIQKLSSRSVALGVNVMVPNSLGPAELLVEYGTEEQKDHYLPRLAVGQEIPCFALTEPTAGSDAGSITSYGELFKGDDGELYIRLNWNKRWITLAAVSTLLGLAFRLRDPENHLGRGEDIGITCALIPTSTPGVMIGRRHDPLGVPFYNCPTHGKDVVIPASQIIGGIERAGQGWTMLMESLAAGRGISLPAQSASAGKFAHLVTGAHATVRKQFGVSVGKFEGVEEPLARIGGFNYILEACRVFTAGSIDSGTKPPVVTAIVKYHSTELMRKVVNDAMDVLGGAGISCGPRNTMAHAYMGAPISITVEGANIMTRTLIIFGQGVLRAHPFAYAEVKAVEEKNLAAFDRAFWGHVGHIVQNSFRSVLLSLSRGWLSCGVSSPTRRYYQKLSWASASFSIMADIAMGALGGKLKLREKVTGRFADIISWLYLCTAVLRRWEAEGRKKEDLPFVHFAMQHGLSEMQAAFDGLFRNFEMPLLGWFFRLLGRWSSFNTLSSRPTDLITHQVAAAMQEVTAQRERMVYGVYIPTQEGEAVARLERAFELAKKSEGVEKKLRSAVRSRQIPRARGLALAQSGLEKGVISAEEMDLLKQAEEARYDAIQVDDFSPEEYFRARLPRESQNSMARPVTSHLPAHDKNIPSYKVRPATD